MSGDQVYGIQFNIPGYKPTDKQRARGVLKAPKVTVWMGDIEGKRSDLRLLLCQETNKERSDVLELTLKQAKRLRIVLQQIEEEVG